MTTRRHRAVTLQQASTESPTLAKLTALATDSGERLRCVSALVPVSLRASISPGPVEGSTWCLLVNSNAAASKVRQLVPAMLAQLRTKGWDVREIRLKVQT